MGNPPSVRLAMKRITALSAARGTVAVQTELSSVNMKLGVCRYFALSGQCLPCSAQTTEVVYGANLVFTISMTIAMVLFPKILLSFW